MSVVNVYTSNNKCHELKGCGSARLVAPTDCKLHPYHDGISINGTY